MTETEYLRELAKKIVDLENAAKTVVFDLHALTDALDVVETDTCYAALLYIANEVERLHTNVALVELFDDIMDAEFGGVFPCEETDD